MLILGLFSAVKPDPKIKLHHMGKILLVNLEDYIFLKLFTTEKLWDGLPVFRK